MTRSAPRPTAYVVPHTHWDREWYLPFESFRVRLVNVIDRLLDVMATNPEYRVFTLDGQTIVLKDYLAVRPDREDDLRSLTEAKRLRIGPWHVLADEFLVSPESLIRNLAQGARICAAFGDRLAVMYTPDSFGHISQLPLFAREFGLDSIVFERGVGDEGETLGGEFLWQSADGGTSVFTHHLVTTYSSAAAIGHADWEMTDAYDPDRAARHARAALYGHENVDLSYMPDWFRASLERVAGGSARYASGDALLLLNGSDHLYAQANIPELIEDLEQRIPNVDFVQSDIESFVEHARDSAEDLELHRGEFRGSRYQHVLSGVLSARMYLKQANDAAQTRLETYTEPLCALAWAHGAPYPRALLHHAWSTLLENHPHDSICGCSVDPVHDAMMVRFASVHHIAEPLEQRALRTLAGSPGSECLTVFHPHPFAATRVVEATVTLPGEHDGEIEVVAPDGSVAPATVRLQERLAPGRTDQTATDARILFEARLPGLGCASYRLRTRGGERAAPTPEDAPETAAGAEANVSATIENDALRLEVTPDGALVLTHKSSGEQWPLDLRWMDDADAGDSYDFSPLDEPTVIERKPDAPPRRIERGPLRNTLRLDYTLDIPQRLADDRRSREGWVELPITLDLTLEAHRPSLGVRIEVDNRAKDHRLRLCLATGEQVDHVHAEGHFDVVRRPVATPGGPEWFQAARATNHQRRFVAVHHGRRGLAVLNRGLPEYEATATERGVDLTVTLLRCVGWLSRDDLASRPQGAGPALPTPGAQCPGRHTFDLAILPLVGAEPWPDLAREADLFAAPPLAFAVDGDEHGAEGAFESLLDVPPPLTMTALKVADTRDTLLARIWNPSPSRVEGSIALGFSPIDVHEVRFDETRLGRIDCTGRTVRLAIPSQGVQTVEFVLSSKGVVTTDASE